MVLSQSYSYKSHQNHLVTNKFPEMEQSESYFRIPLLEFDIFHYNQEHLLGFAQTQYSVQKSRWTSKFS